MIVYPQTPVRALKKSSCSFHEFLRGLDSTSVGKGKPEYPGQTSRSRGACDHVLLISLLPDRGLGAVKRSNKEFMQRSF